MRQMLVSLVVALVAGCQEPGSVQTDQGVDRAKIDGGRLDAVGSEARRDVRGTEARPGDSIRSDTTGLSWKTMTSGTTGTLTSVWGTGPTNVYAAGNSSGIIRYDGTGWATAWTPPVNVAIRGIGGRGPNDIYAVGGLTGPIIHYDGSSWNTQPSGYLFPINDVWASSSTDIFAVGDWGGILHSDGKQWSTMIPYQGASGWRWLSVSGSGPKDVYAASSAELRHYDGTMWSKVSGVSCISGVWVVSAKEAYASGCTSQVYHFDGTQWTPHSTGVSVSLNDIWASNGRAFAVGEQGTIVYYDGSQWSTMKSGVTEKLNSVWGSSPSDVYAVGDSGTIVHYGP